MINYATLHSNFNYLFFSTMYNILVDNKIVDSFTDKNIAFANYRSYCRDYKNKSSSIKLMLDDSLLHAKSADLQLLDDVDDVSTNDIVKLVLERLNITAKQLKERLKNTDLNVSNSRIDGWLRNDPADRKYTKMHNDELYVVLDVLLQDNQSAIKSPANIVKLRKKLGLTQSQLAEILEMRSGFRQVARWESGEAEMPDKKWKKLQNLLK